jgi:type I restriction-modification system DNA methylase subunit
MSDLRTFTLWARGLLTQEAGDLLQQVYRLDVQTGARLPIPHGHLLESSPEAQTIRKRIEKLLEDEVDAGLKREEAVAKLIKETAFTHLNRLVAFKLMEARGLIRSPLSRRHEANGFKMWLAARPAEEALYNQGDSPNDRDGFGEAPRDRAYRHFLLWQCGELAREIQVLFDPDNMPSLLFPRPGVLKELVDALNADERKDDWAAGNEETVGWVYQFFTAEEKAAAFDRVFKKKKKFEKTDVPAATQVFTPRWVVRFLVENSLGRLWLSMHQDSDLAERCVYLTPLPAGPPASAMKPAREIRVLDPATGTMHFGLVAFDLLAEMYREELTHAGRPGWPAHPSVATESEIPAAILANNLFGIDIDLRAVQLAALALYLKAKGANKQAILTESNLACADVAIFRGQHLTKISSEMALPRGITRELFVKFRDSLEEACMMGSLVRLDRHFQNFESGQLRQAIDAYVEKKRAEGVDESYFANETSKGIRLLNVLERRYDVVCTNPPYMSNRNMNSAMSDFMKRNYKKSKGDLYSAFIERCAELLGPEGRQAMITQQSFMFISSFANLRDVLLGATAIETMAHVGPRAFAEVTGEKVNTTAFVLRREQLDMERRNARGIYFRLVKEPDAESKRTAFEQALARRRAGQPESRVYEYRQGDFAAIPGSPWVYWITPGLLALFSKLKKLEDVAQPRVGLQTGFNERYLRYWWEVGLPRVERMATNGISADKSGKRWFPYMKGGSFQRWFGNQDFIVNWLRDGQEIKACTPNSVIRNPECYFRRGVTWTDLTARKFSARLSPGGFVFDVSGSSVFPEDLELVLAVMNSTWAQYALKLINPTVHVQVGDLARLPLPKHSSAQLRDSANRAIAFARADSEEDETAYDFIAPPAWPDGAQFVTARHRDLAGLEKEIDEEIYRLYEISPEDRRAIEEELAAAPESGDDAEEDEAKGDEEAADAEEAASLTQEELAHRWMSFAVGVALGRFSRPGLESLVDEDGLMVVQRDHPDDLAARVIAILATIHGDTESGRIIGSVIGDNGDLRDALASYLLGPFFKAHVKRYRKRPVYWLVQSPKQKYSVYLLHERATDQTLAVLQGGRYLGGRIFQLKQQLEDANRQEADAEGREKAKWRKQAQDLAEELADLEAIDQAITATNNEPIVDAEGKATTSRWAPELDDGVLLNAAPLYRLTPAWKRADAKLDLGKVWKMLKDGEYPWAKTAMRYWPHETLKACKDNKSYRIAHGLE